MTTIVPVRDEAAALEVVAEFLEYGVEAVPLVRTVTAWSVDEDALTRARFNAARKQVLHIAELCREEELQQDQALAELRPFAPAMSEADRAARLDEVLSELDHRDRIGRRDYDDDLNCPDMDHDALLADAERRVNEAADKLIAEPAFDAVLEAQSIDTRLRGVA
jgi:predicted RecB family endonuclease